MDKIHWLHLSDIHLNKRDVDSRRMRNRLLDYMKELGTQIDYIFITGRSSVCSDGRVCGRYC